MLPRHPAGLRRTRSSRQVQVERLESRALLTLFPGNPLNVSPTTPIAAIGTADVTVAIAAFKTAVGGPDNGNVAAPQSSGFRAINWDGVAVDGTDFGGGANTTVINAGKTVGIPQNRFETRGVLFDTIYAVSNDGFSDVNPAAANLFPAYSAKNTFAMFNDNTIDFSFVAPGAPGSATVPAASRGFGAVFINSEIANTSSIEYFHGDQSLAKFFVPAGTPGQPEFLGELFDNPIVTRVSITLGTDTLFSFDGSNPTAGGTDGGLHNLVVTDDFVYPEPVPLPNLPAIGSGPPGTSAVAPVAQPSVGVPFTGTVATVSSSSTTASSSNFFAVINWGDGHQTNGVVQKNLLGGFDVIGTNTYASAGLFPVTVTVDDFSGGQVTIANTAQVNKQATTITLASSANPVTAGKSITFTATLGNPGASPGTVTFLDNGVTFLGTGTVVGSTASLTTTLAPGFHQVTAVYSGNAATLDATSAAIIQGVNPDVTTAVKLAIIRTRRAGRKVVERLRITNPGSQAIGGPLLLAIDNLSANAALVNAAGTTKTLLPLGSPYVVLVPGAGNALNGGGATLDVDLTFLVKRGKLSFTLRLLSGVTTP
jgi:Bacterial Ig-like domain (group 3)